MAKLEGTSFTMEVDDSKAARVTAYPRGPGYGIGTSTGTIAAALAANSAVFVARLNPSSTFRTAIKRVFGQYTTVVAYTTPVTAGRRLSLYRGSGAAASGGTAIASVGPKLSTDVSDFNASAGGDVRVATTGALTVTGITFEAQEFSSILLVGNGAAGSIKDFDFKYDGISAPPLILTAGQLIAIRNPAAMDAAGTWQLCVNVEWEEYTQT